MQWTTFEGDCCAHLHGLYLKEKLSCLLFFKDRWSDLIAKPPNSIALHLAVPTSHNLPSMYSIRPRVVWSAHEIGAYPAKRTCRWANIPVDGPCLPALVVYSNAWRVFDTPRLLTQHSRTTSRPVASQPFRRRHCNTTRCGIYHPRSVCTQ